MMYQHSQPQLQSTPNHLQPILTPQTIPHQQQQSLLNTQMNNSAQHDLTITDIDKEKEKQARENHCEIERRRRVKMAAYFNELCVMVPTCNTLQRKPDKLTILRMASSHMRNLRQANSNSSNMNQSMNDNSYKPSFLTDQELKHLILEAADGFLFVAQCDTGNIIYVSDAVQPVLSYMPTEWTNRSLFEFVHPDDLEKVKDQLSTQETSSVNSSGRILDLKTGTVKKEGHPNSVRSHLGSRRSFICRVRIGHSKQGYLDPTNGLTYPTSSGIWSANSRSNRNRNTLQTDLNDQKSSGYSVVHVTGYTKIWPPNNGSSSGANQNILDQHGLYNNHYSHSFGSNHHLEDQAQNSATNFHLIAIARIQMTSTPNDLVNSSNCEFVTRHDQHGNITFVDQRVTALLGYQSSDMLKKQLSDFCVIHDQQMIKDQLKMIYETKQTQPIQFNLHLIPSSSFNNSPTSNSNDSNSSTTAIKFKTSAYAFCNPCNEQFEFIICTHVNQTRLNELTSNSNNNNNNTNSVSSTSSSTNSNLYQNTSHLLASSSIEPTSHQYQYHAMNQYNHQHIPPQANNYQLGLNSHLSAPTNSLYTNPSNYLIMSNMNSHDMYVNTANNNNNNNNTNSSSTNGSTNQLTQSSSSNNLTLLHNVPTSNNQNTWSTNSTPSF